MAPAMLSSPPTITTGRTLRPRMASEPSTPPRMVASRMPPAAETTAAMLQESAKMRRTEMPIDCATCWTAAVARMAMPGRAYWKKRVRSDQQRRATDRRRCRGSRAPPAAADLDRLAARRAPGIGRVSVPQTPMHDGAQRRWRGRA